MPLAEVKVRLYEVDDVAKAIYVMAVRHRRDAYRTR
jgi:mRNA-degrading endonuclease RelE of RelBE toxin-antitoxin system